MISQFDAYAVQLITGLSAFTTEARAREIAARAYPASQKVELVTVTTASGLAVSAWVMKARRVQA